MPNGIVIEPIQGPMCHDPYGPSWKSYCYHDSCQWIGCNGRIVTSFGPMCESRDYMGYCPHESCAIEPEQEFCARHGWQLVVESASGTGFAGGRIFWCVLACGCVDLDESDDVRAAE